MSLLVRVLLGSLFVIGISGCAPGGDSGGDEAPADSMPMEEMTSVPGEEMTEAMPLQEATPAEDMSDEMSDDMSAEGDDAGDMAEMSDDMGDMDDMDEMSDDMEDMSDDSDDM